ARARPRGGGPVSCPCDDRAFPGAPDIPAGLDRLPRQIATFAEFRRALLDGIDEQVALADWRARGGDDFGVMMLEWWAYVLDVLAFYSGEIATESYLRTARRDASLQRLVALIGYTPKPKLSGWKKGSGAPWRTGPTSARVTRACTSPK
ncbi:MAG: hypothetical protein AAFW46_19020, partial [Pseudomonadota bacterium]